MLLIKFNKFCFKTHYNKRNGLKISPFLFVLRLFRL